MNFTLKMDAGDWMARAEAVKDIEIKNICFKNAVSANPESEDARLGLAKSFEDKKQTKNAISEYEEILKKNPQSTEVLTALVPLYAQTRKTGKLIETYKALASVDRGKADQYYLKAATAAEKSGLTAEAIDLYKKSLAANSASAEARAPHRTSTQRPCSAEAATASSTACTAAPSSKSGPEGGAPESDAKNGSVSRR